MRDEDTSLKIIQIMANFPTWKIGLMYEELFEFEI